MLIDARDMNTIVSTILDKGGFNFYQSLTVNDFYRRRLRSD